MMNKIIPFLCVLALPMILSPLGPSWVRTLDFVLLYMILAVGLNVLVGYTGLLNLGYMAFYGIGAYTYALCASPQLAMHLPCFLALLLAMLVAGFAGVLVGSTAIRLRGDYLAIVTLGFGEMVRIFLNNLNRPINITNGPQGITSVDPFRLGGLDFSRDWVLHGWTIPSLYLWYYLFLFFLVGAVLISLRLERSYFGCLLMAIRCDERAALAVGIRVYRCKLVAFVISAVFGGMAGAFFASFQGFISPESFSIMESFLVLTMVVLGGLGSMWGALLGAATLVIFPELLRCGTSALQTANFYLSLPSFVRDFFDPEIMRQLILSLAMILIILFRPAGLYSFRPRPTPQSPEQSQLPEQ